MNENSIDRGLAALALGMMLWGAYYGLVTAPPERAMGDVYRIMYVHVPAAWLTLVAFAVNLIASLAYLLGRGGLLADAVAEASAEIGVLFNLLLLITGSIWGKVTWGVWWTWDPRLTTAAIMFFCFAGYLALRSFVDDHGQRATWSAVVAIIIFADVPIVWFSVKWFNSLHQLQSSPATVAPQMVTALRLNAFAFLAVYAYFMRLRLRQGLFRLGAEQAPVPLQAGETP